MVSHIRRFHCDYAVCTPYLSTLKKSLKRPNVQFLLQKVRYAKSAQFHESKKHTTESMEVKKKMKCGFCDKSYTIRAQLYHHRMKVQNIPKPKSILKKTSNSQA